MSRPLNLPRAQDLVPTELWGEIFTQILPHGEHTLCSPTAVPLALSQVSNHWRAVALSLPSLWSSLKIVLSNHHPTPSLSFIQLWLKRAGWQPLALTLELDIFPPAPFTLVNAASSILRLFATRCYFWRELKLALPGSHMLFHTVMDCAAPSLQCLDLDLRNWQAGEIGDINLFLRKAPILQRFKWSNRETWVSWDIPSINTMLPRLNWHSLHHLVLDSWLTFEESYSILRQCQNLITCDLRRFGAGEPITDPSALDTVLFLPCLKSLKIYQHRLDEALGSFLELLVSPQLLDLSITCGRVEDVLWPQRHFMTFLSQSSCSLKVLCLEYTGINEEDVQRCLQAIPTLGCLEVYDAEDDICAQNKLFAILTQDAERRGIICPNVILR